MQDPLTDCSHLISAAASGKLRLVRLLVEGGAQVNGSNSRGETALLAACKALRGEPAGPEAVKLLRYLLQNKADPNAQDHAGRTALMYACMERAGVQVAQTLLAAGADPCMEDFSGASALVYAISAQHQPMVQALMDACRARGCDIIIIATEKSPNGNQVTRRYLNVPSSPDSSPVSCMSPSDIVLKTGSPNSSEGENIFNFRGASRHGSGRSSRRSSCELNPLNEFGSPAFRPRISSEPWLAVQNLASLNRTYNEGVRERSLKGEGDRQGLGRQRGGSREDEDEELYFGQLRVEQSKESVVKRRDNSCRGDFSLRVSTSVLSLTEKSSSLVRCPAPGGSSSAERLPGCPSSRSQLRRNTLPSLSVVPPLLHLPPLKKQSNAHLQVPSQVSPSRRRAALPPLSSSATSLVAPHAGWERSRRLQRRHSMQLEQI